MLLNGKYAVFRLSAQFACKLYSAHFVAVNKLFRSFNKLIILYRTKVLKNFYNFVRFAKDSKHPDLIIAENVMSLFMGVLCNVL